ncbi:hypothetical protein [Deinococcus sp. QL22]|uniref:hypothetical protein n=1 Tax=Deinococcus sp. QL22 TaxID=2939437 RepID=UPI002017BECC|nr:hypothetical protein [Deinococcus sp. QL22]UQN08235.1 hypothetical protein M1R55_19350 [Deinococcus sp. QL22]
MQPQDFAAKWRELAPKLSERAAYQEHWHDLCALLGEPRPSSDLTGEAYAFEKHVKKAGSALVTAHTHLDHAVAAAYGWEWPLTEDEVLARLLALNLERAAVVK